MLDIGSTDKLIGQPEASYSNYSSINNGTVRLEGIEYYNLDFEIVDLEERVIDKLKFTWEFIEFLER